MVLFAFAKQEGWGGLTGLAPPLPVFTSWAQTQTRFFQVLPPLLPSQSGEATVQEHYFSNRLRLSRKLFIL